MQKHNLELSFWALLFIGAVFLCSLAFAGPAHALDAYVSFGAAEQTEGVRLVNLEKGRFVEDETVFMTRIALVQPLSDTVSIRLEHSRYSVLDSASVPAGYSALLFTVKLF